MSVGALFIRGSPAVASLTMHGIRHLQLRLQAPCRSASQSAARRGEGGSAPRHASCSGTSFASRSAQNRLVFFAPWTGTAFVFLLRLKDIPIKATFRRTVHEDATCQD